jgi:hypothetical protein
MLLQLPRCAPRRASAPRRGAVACASPAASPRAAPPPAPAAPRPGRRALLAAGAAAALAAAPAARAPHPAAAAAAPLSPAPADPGAAAAAAAASNDWAVPVLITLAPGLVAPSADTFPAAALYITLRPVGRGPPLAARRVALASLPQGGGAAVFPLRLLLGPADALPDAPAAADWRAAPQLLVSARLDVDGTAATRDPDDLVGRGAAPGAGAQGGGAAWGEAAVTLVGRGLAGRLATQRT